MRPSSSSSKCAVLSQNSTRPSHRRRRRLRFELQLERLEERSLLSTGLVAAYNFNAGSGAVLADVSGNGNNGTITNATWTTSGKYGDALVFNGTNALVTIPDSTSLNLTTGMTLEAWVNPSTVSSAWRDVIYKGNDNYWLEATSIQRRCAGCRGDAGLVGRVYARHVGLDVQHLDVSDGDLQRVDPASVRQRDSGLEPGAVRGTSRPRPTRCKSAETASTDSTSRE